MTFRPETFALPDDAMRAVDAGALVVVNDSGGKDSAALAILTSRIVPPEQRLHLHATLDESEWPGALEQARDNAGHLGGHFEVVQSKHSFLSLVAGRFHTRPDIVSWPSPQFRRCTSDLKTFPLNSRIKAYAKAHGFTKVVNAMGLRAEESRNRAKKPLCMTSKTHSTLPRTLKNGAVRPGREWLDVLPIHALSTEEVFGVIKDAGLVPHYAYGLGNERVSCVLCIMGSRCDAQNGALHNPAVYQKYAAMEVLTGWAMHPSRKTLPQLTGIPVNTQVVDAYRGRLEDLARPGLDVVLPATTLFNSAAD